MRWLVLLAACNAAPVTLPSDGGRSDLSAAQADVDAGGDGGGGVLLAISPTQLTARQHVGGVGETPLVFRFTAPADLNGAGLPPDLVSASFDGAVAELELPLGGSTDENAMSSVGLVSFDAPRLCLVGSVSCAGQDGYWKATVESGGTSREVQLAMSEIDLLTKKAVYTTFGVYLAQGDSIHAGDVLTLEFTGKVTARATDWTDQPFITHFRYRSANSAAWVVLDDDQVQPLQIVADGTAKFVHALAPLDVAAGAPFTTAVVVTDHYGNPRPITGSVMLSGGVTEEVQFSNEWRKEVTVTYPSPGPQKIVPSLAGARGLYHYTQVWPSPPPVQRLVGDVHSHSGDGGAQRKFIGTFLPGDHRALYSRTHDALRYMREVAGFDFGALSEHAVRWDSYTPPAAVAADSQFQTGGACAGAGVPIPSLGDWFTTHQQIVQAFDQAAAGSFIAFPAFEWHGTHAQTGDTSPLHRIILFHDFSPGPSAPLPILPGDIENLSPLSVAPRSQIDSYMRIGEIYSARAIDQGRAYGTATLSVFERADRTGGRWAYRYGWRQWGAHIGVIGSSDNHEQMPGVNDDVDLDGVNYHSNEPGGYAVVLSPTKDRDGIFGALGNRMTYATSGIRAWLDYNVDGSPMGSEIARASGASATAQITILAGLEISTVELWTTQVGSATATYTTVATASPNAETFTLSVPLQNPVAPGGGTQEWLYYVRAYFKAPSSTADADEALWSSPIWVTWTN